MQPKRLRFGTIAAWLGVIALGFHALVPIHLAFSLAAESSRSLECGGHAARNGVRDGGWHLLALLTGQAEGSHHADPRHGAHQPAQCAVCGAIVAFAGFIPAPGTILPLPIRLEPVPLSLTSAEIRPFQTPLIYRSQAPPFDAASAT